MYFPTYRMRRLRRTPTLRRMMRETALSPDDFIYPLFVSHGENVKRPIPSMPGCEQLSNTPRETSALRFWKCS